MPSIYGHAFDRLAETWATIENEHDKKHPDRDECGGVGGCSMMFTANRLQGEMIEALTEWRWGRL
jgi:dihydroxyacid dehydratase/phosphogluconate dehydratase